MKISTPVTLLVLVTLIGGIPQAVPAQNTRPGAIMGLWHGTSICVKASWNAACNDEVTEYDFVPGSTDSMRGTIHAFKIVQGVRDSMGALPITFAPTAQRWDARFTSRRGDARWSFWIHGDTLLGELLVNPDSQVARHVVALRPGGQPSARAPHN